LGATLSFSTAIAKGIRKVLGAALSFVGFLFRGGFVFVRAGQVTGSNLAIHVTGSNLSIHQAGSDLHVQKTDQ